MQYYIWHDDPSGTMLFDSLRAAADQFTALAGRGVKVEILTNSLEATDMAVVHAGYAKRRKDLLRAGISLFELRRLTAAPERGDKSLVRGGSSGSSPHAKTFSVDGARVFVGSFNFDPRSMDLNTELGFVINSTPLARTIQSAIHERLPETAYQVLLSDDGDLYWVEQREGQVVRHDTEPGTNFWMRACIWLMSLLPIEWML